MFRYTLLLLLLALPVRAQETGCPANPVPLAINNVEANYYTNKNDLFWYAGYHVGTGYVMRMLHLWFAGLDSTGTVRFSHGLNQSGTFPADTRPSTVPCAWVLSRKDLLWYNESGIATEAMRTWPWEAGAPVVDGDGNPDNYNLAGGDRPQILGDQTIYWISHDPGISDFGDASWNLPLETHVTAYAYDRPAGDPLHHTTFLRVRYINKSGQPLSEVYAGLDTDVEMGRESDNYVASDSLRHMAYFYNADSYDVSFDDYGVQPPAFGIVVTDSPPGTDDARDNDHDGLTDEPGERLGLTSFLSFQGGGHAAGRPAGPQDYYRYLKGVWRDDRPMLVGGYGHNYGPGETTRYMYSGDPVTGEYWTMENLDGEGDQARGGYQYGVLGVGPFDLAPEEAAEVEYAFVWSQHTNRLFSVEQLRRDVDALFYGTPPPAVPAVPDTPRLVVPADGQTDVQATVDFHWQGVPAPDDAWRFYQFQLSPTPDFDHDRAELPFLDMRLTRGDTTVSVGGLWVHRTYYWRVRAETMGGASAWSAVRTITVGDQAVVPDDYTGFFTVANQDGPLAEPVGAAAPWQGFPSPTRPTAASTGMRGQWLIHAFDDSTRASYDAFINRTTWGGQFGDFGFAWIVPYDFEIRFTEAGSRAYDYASGCYFEVPFELWRIGIGTPDDPSDDLKLPPYVLDADLTAVLGTDDLPPFNLLTERSLAAAAAYRFPFGSHGIPDHTVDDGNDDPQTDRIFFTIPDDTTYGTAGYDAWQAYMDATVGLGNCDGSGDEFGELTARFSIHDLVLVSWDGGDVCNDTDGDGTCEVPSYQQALPPTGAVFRITTSKPARFTSTEPTLDVVLPRTLHLHGNYPNPFNPVTQIAFDLPEDAAVRVSVYDLLGRRVALVEAGVVAAGIARTVRVDGSGWASGVYLYRVEARGARQAWQQTGRMLLVK